jgi:hypothetical protein
MQEELPALVASYERRGYFDQIVALLTSGLVLERAHVCWAKSLLLMRFSHLIDGYLHRARHLAEQIPTR